MSSSPSEIDINRELSYHSHSPYFGYNGPKVEIYGYYQKKLYIMDIPEDVTVGEFQEDIGEVLNIPPSLQKLMVPKMGVLKDPEMPIIELVGKKVTIFGSKPEQVQGVQDAVDLSTRRLRSRYLARRSGARPSRQAADAERKAEESRYTFLKIVPLANLPHPERARDRLQALKDHPGIKSVMRKHRWTVPILTEMNPAEHTTHESRTLGLNRNKGEVIELRLRTDEDYGAGGEGWRDQKTVLKTLCHELTHNVHSEHDSDFWSLCKQIEKDVATADWMSGGRSLTDSQVYNGADPSFGEDDDDHQDGGGWQGGEFTLGGGTLRMNTEGRQLTMREILAQAAEQRLKSPKSKDPESEDSPESTTPKA